MLPGVPVQVVRLVTSAAALGEGFDIGIFADVMVGRGFQEFQSEFVIVYGRVSFRG